MSEIDLNFDEKGLIPAILQDYHTREVLMLAYMNKEAFDKTLATGKATFWSRSRKKLWVKGETSGNFMNVVRIAVDCDEDALLLEVIPEGPACHTGNRTCFYREIYENEKATGNSDILTKIARTIEDRKHNPTKESYTNYLLSEGIDKILKKVGEESSETIIAAKNHEPQRIAEEMGDLIYHLEVLLAEEEMSLDDVYKVLETRHGKVSDIRTQDKKKRGEI